MHMVGEVFVDLKIHFVQRFTQNKAGVVGEKERKLVMEFARAMVAANEIDRSAEGCVLDAIALFALKNNGSDAKEVCGSICREIVESHHR